MKRLIKIITVLCVSTMVLTGSVHTGAINKDNKVYWDPDYAMKASIIKNQYIENDVDRKETILQDFQYSTKEEYSHIDLGDISRSSKLTPKQIEKLLPDNLKDLSDAIYTRDTVKGTDSVNAIYLISQIKLFTGNGKEIYGHNLFGIRNRRGPRTGKLKVYNSYEESLNDYIYYLDRSIISLNPDKSEERAVAYICKMAGFPLEWTTSTYDLCIGLNNSVK